MSIETPLTEPAKQPDTSEKSLELEKIREKMKEIIIALEARCLKEKERFPFPGISKEGMTDLEETNTIFEEYDVERVKDIQMTIEKFAEQGFVIIPGKTKYECILIPADYLDAHYADYTPLKDADGNIFLKDIRNKSDINNDLVNLYSQKKESEGYALEIYQLSISEDMDKYLAQLIKLMMKKKKTDFWMKNMLVKFVKVL